MDLTPIRPTEDLRGARESLLRQPGRPDAAMASAGASAPPQADGVLAPPDTDRGETRDAAAERHTRDRQALVDEFLADLTRKAGLPGTTRLQIRLDPDREFTQFVVVDKATGEVIRTIPPDEAAALLDEQPPAAGLFVDEQF